MITIATEILRLLKLPISSYCALIHCDTFSSAEYRMCKGYTIFRAMQRDMNFMIYLFFSQLLCFVPHSMNDKMPFLSQLRFAIFWLVNIDCFFLTCGTYTYVPANLLILFLCVFFILCSDNS